MHPQYSKVRSYAVAFYLLDAISKNVFDPYARQFAPLVIQLFLDSYRVVDQNTRSKMEEMLLTWRTGGANGKELFGVVPQVTIERGVWGGGSSHTDVRSRRWKTPRLGSSKRLQPASGFYSGSGQISKSQVISELEFVPGQKERAVQSNPYNATAQTHIGVLQAVHCLYFFSIYPVLILFPTTAPQDGRNRCITR